MHNFLVLYRGRTISEAKIVALSSDRTLVAEFAARLLQEGDPWADQDPTLGELRSGRERALRLISSEEVNLG